MKFAKLCVTLLAPLLLTGCFLVPGAFVSSMDLRKDGSFTFAYKGELIFQSPNEIMKDSMGQKKVWSDTKTRCFKDGSDPFYDEYASDTPPSTDDPVDENSRPCTVAERATLKKNWDAEQAAKVEKDAREAQQFATIFGFNPSDEEANRKLAATMMKYDGWRSVTYRGKGVFDVDYSLTSKAGHDYLFPLIPQGDYVIPFVQLRKRESGSVAVNAPALVGGGMRALAARAKAFGGAVGGSKDMPGPSQVTRGTFTLTTDGEILTNNTDDGPMPDPKGKKLVWDIGPATEKIPEALVRLR